MLHTLDHGSRIEEDIDKCEYLARIDLSNRELGDQDMNGVVQDALIDNKCSSLWLHDNIFTFEGVRTLADSILINNTLQELFLDGNQISDMGVHYLSLILNDSALVSLSLSENSITDEGAKDLAEVLKTNKKVRYLWLYLNRIGDQGVQIFANVLTHYNTTLERLDLRSNKLVTDASVKHLLLMLESNESLRIFWMEYCNLSYECKAKLRQTAKLKNNLHFGA